MSSGMLNPTIPTFAPL